MMLMKIRKNIVTYDSVIGRACGVLCAVRYCECYQAGIFCSDNCKCIDCKNFEVSWPGMFRSTAALS